MLQIFRINQVVLFLIFFLFINLSFNKTVSHSYHYSYKSVVDHLGLIKTKGNRIVDKNGNEVALHGMSLFWSQFGGKYYNEDCIKWLRDDWKCTVVRAACGVELENGYLEKPAEEMAKVISVIEAAINTGIYVIVDWHDHNAQRHLPQAKEFFKTIAQKYGDKANIIYEIYNEPLRVSWADSVKPYTEEIVSLIREYDPDNLIVAGNPNWSQYVDVAAKDPVNDVNLAYTLHFYTSTHKQWLRDKAISALDTSGAPLFVTEFGISEANGDGIIDYDETEAWLAFSDSNKLSTCGWSIMDKEETSAALKPGASPKGNWSESDLTESGIFLRNRIRALNSHIFDTIEAKE